MQARHRRMSLTLFGYIARETALSFLIAFLFFFFIFFVNQILLLAEQVLSKNAPLFDVLLLMIYSLPSVIAISAPFAALVGVLLAIGRLSSDNEIIIMRASGISYRIVYIPILILGLLISLLSFFVNDVLLPAGTLEFGKVYRKVMLSTPALQMEANTAKKFKDIVLVTGPIEDRDISQVLILDKTDQGEDRLIMASHATLIDGGRNHINLSLNNAFVHTEKPGKRGDYEYILAEDLDYSINQKEVMPQGASVGPREMSSVDVARSIRDKEIKIDEKLAAKGWKLADAGFALEAFFANPEAYRKKTELAKAYDRYASELRGFEDIKDDRSLRSYILEFHKKFTLPFGALFLVFLATPVALFSRKSGQSFTFAFGLFISVLYWALLLGGQTYAIRMDGNPILPMWAPNIAALFAGLVLTILRVAL